MRLILIILSLSFFTSCGNDDDSPTCNVVDTEADITIDGNHVQFVKNGYGLDLLASGRHKLVLYYSVINTAQGNSGNMQITTLFRDTGTDMISKCTLNVYGDNGSIQVDLAEGNFNSNIISNNPHCFEASFSGSIQTEVGLLTFSDGYASFVYDEPLEDYTFGRLIK